MTSDRAPEKIALYWQKALNSALKLALFCRDRLIFGDFLSLYFSPNKFVTKTAYPLNQCIANCTTTMNDGGGARGGEYGIFKTKS